MAKLEDLTPMPFGKHKDTPLQDVPASYLFWYWTKTDKFHEDLNSYIRENMDALTKEYPDGIWKED